VPTQWFESRLSAMSERDGTAQRIVPPRESDARDSIQWMPRRKTARYLDL
jgi:hypothetical protein